MFENDCKKIGSDCGDKIPIDTFGEISLKITQWIKATKASWYVLTSKESNVPKILHKEK